MASNSNIQKIFSNYLFRVMTAWFGVYIMDKVKAAIAYVIDRAGFIYVKTQENAQKVLDFFNTHDLYIDDDIYRFIEVENSPVTGYNYKFGLLNDDFTVSTEIVVYGDRRDYDDLQDGDKVYIAQQEELTVWKVELPTEGYVTLTDFDDPVHFIEGTLYGN